MGTVVLLTLMASVAWAGQVRSVRKNLKVEDLGTPAKRRMANWKLIYRAPDGAPHLFVPFCAATGVASDPEATILDFNLSTGEVVSARGPRGGTYCRPGWVHPNGKMYCTVTRPVSLLEYDPAAKKLRIVGRLAGFYNTIQDVSLAPDGVIFFGHNGRQLTSYDPATDTLGDHGVMGGGKNTTNQFIYDLVAAERYVYCAMANHGAWYLVVYDRKEKKQHEYFKPPAGERSPVKHVWTGADGNIYYGAGRNLWRCEGGKPVKVEKPTRIDRVNKANVWSFGQIDTVKEFGLELDTSGFTPTNWNGGVVTLKWRKPEAKEWRTATFEGLDVVPNVVRRLAVGPDGLMYGFGAFYGPVFSFDPKTLESKYVGPSPGSVYDMLVTKDHVYLCGYSTFFSIYDRSRPYGSEGNIGKFRDKSLNPYKMKGAGKRTFRMLQAADGTIYACGNYSRHSTGADAMYHTPGTLEGVWLREDLKNYHVSDMCLVDGGKRVAFSLKSRDKENPGIFLMVFDNTTKKIEKTIKVDIDAPDAGAIFSPAPGQVTGLIRIEETKNLLFNVDLATGKLLFQKDVPGRAFKGVMKNVDMRGIDQRFCVGPDGCGWLFIDRNLSRIRPDGAIEKIMEIKTPGQLLFHGDDLYIYNGGRSRFGGFAGILRIQSVFQ